MVLIARYPSRACLGSWQRDVETLKDLRGVMKNSRSCQVVRWVSLSLMLLLVGLCGQVDAQDHVGQYLRADVEHGAQLYEANCTRCHGTGGDMVVGANLRDGQFRRVSTDSEVMTVITTGIPGTAMPPASFTQSELAGLVAYLRNMATYDLDSVALGDAGRGEQLFRGKGECSSCHRVNGVGPRAAPDLSAIGTTRSAGSLEQVLLDPTAVMRPTNRPVRLVTRDGTIVQGRRLNEDTYSIQLVDANERLVSLDKADLREFTILTTSPMPSYEETLTAEERADVLAYLLMLKGM